MKRSMVVVLAVLAVLALAVPTFAALNASQQKELQALQQKMFDLQKQMVQKQLEYGQITKDQADAMTQQIDAAAKYVAENPDAVSNRGAGRGWRGGRGRGMMGGMMGYGMGPAMMGGAGPANCPYYNNDGTTSNSAPASGANGTSGTSGTANTDAPTYKQ